MVDDPPNRLGRIANSMLMTGKLHGEHDKDDRFIVMIMNGHDGMISTEGYENPDHDFGAMSDLIIHVQAIFEANGKYVQLAFLNPDGSVETI